MKEKEYNVSYMAGQPDHAMSVLDLFQASKDGIIRFSNQIIDEVKEGRVDPLRVALLMKTVEKIKDEVNNVLSPYYLREAEKYGEKPFSYHGAEIQATTVRTEYDYSACHHPEWDELSVKIAEFLTKQRELETTLKTFHAPQVLVIDGEAVEVAPPVKRIREGIKITIR